MSGVEKLDWEEASTLGDANVRLKRRFEIIDRGLRLVSGGTVTASGRLALISHRTLVLADTTGGAIALSLPKAASVAGYQVDVKVTAGIEPLTMTPFGSETVDGQPDVETYTRLTLVSDGANWIEL